MPDRQNRYAGKQFAIWRLLFAAGISLCFLRDAAAFELSTVPMEVRKNISPPNVMFVFDDSGSMFEDYVFAGGLTIDDWRFYWYGANTLYYNPLERYTPWPRKDLVPLSCISSPDIIWYPGDECAHPGIDGDELAEDAVSYVGLNGGGDSEWAPYDYDFQTINFMWNDLPEQEARATRPTYDFPDGTKTFPRSRYYTGYDANGDGEIKAADGEVYLVVLRYNGGSPQREYYQFFDHNNNGKVDAGELTPVPSLPPEITLKWTDETTGQQYQPTAEQELSNFLQWFVYHRTRMRAAINAIAIAIEQLGGANVGIYTINDHSDCDQRGGYCIRIPPMPIQTDVDGDGVPDLLNYLYDFRHMGGSTPLLQAYLAVAQYFDAADTDAGGFSPAGGSHPFLDADQGGACQQSYAITVTDGEATWRTIPLDTVHCVNDAADMADIARCYYQNDLAPNLDNNLPTRNTDMADWQHLVSYAVSFGIGGLISLEKPNDNVDSAGCRYSDLDGPACFLLSPPTANFWDNGGMNSAIDDLWRSTVEGHGRYINASSPGQLTQAMRDIAADISVRNASAAAAAVNSSQISDDTRVIMGRFDPQTWAGDLYAYKIDYETDFVTGKITVKLDDAHPAWSAAAQLRSTSPNDRLIFTSNGDGRMVNFTASGTNSLADGSLLSDAQRAMLGYDDAAPQNFADFVAWMRGDTSIANLRARKDESGNNDVLGDMVHSSPVLVKLAANGGNTGDVIFVGANDGMLHAFDADNGKERFAYIPSLVHDHLANLSRLDYGHRFYVDGSLVVAPIVYFDNFGQRTVKYLLVSGLGRGGRGYFALDVSQINAVTSFSDIQNQSVLQWEYPRRSMAAAGDGQVNAAAPQPPPPLTYEYIEVPTADQFGGDGIVDNDGQKALYVRGNDGQPFFAYGDNDLGYSYSFPSVNVTYRGVTNMANPGRVTKDSWVVIFGNGYGSRNGRAVLYILDANTGELVRKIDTGVGLPTDENGLSSPAALDVDNDGRIDYVYAGDLQGNLWKFDLTSNDPNDWKVAYNDGGTPKPMFSAPGKSITTRPDIIRHNTRSGYMILFGTGRFLGEPDRATTDTQTLFGIWDVDWFDGIDNDGDGLIDEFDEIKTGQNPNNYLGVWNGTNVNSSLRLNGSLLEQTLLSEYCCAPSDTTNPVCSLSTGTCAAPQTNARITSDYRPDANPLTPGLNWWTRGQGGIYGWYFDLPGYPGDNTTSAERIVRDVVIRDGKVIATSFIPDTVECSKGGTSFLYELDARTGARLKTPQLDISGDGRVNNSDMIDIGGVWFSISGVGYDSLINFGANSVVIGPDTRGSVNNGRNNNEYKIITGADGTVHFMTELRERQGVIFWQEITN